MPTTRETGHGRMPRTLADKLQWLRELKTPRGEQPPSYEATARRITAETGVSISGPYFWELATGRTTNPKLHHLQAIARFFNVPVGYLSEESTDFRQLESELELLHALKQRGVRTLTLQGPTNTQADLATLQTLLSRLQMLDASEEHEVRERLKTLPPRQRQALHEVLNDLDVLDALDDPSLRDLIRAAADLTDRQRAVLTLAVRRADLLNALRSENVRDIALRVAALSDTSQRAVLAMIDHLRQVESPQEQPDNG